jgi:dipeptidyl aminopeptidase/acylaminoacyl peptidase
MSTTPSPRPSGKPYGTWPSPLSAATIAAGTTRLGDLRVDGEDVFWVEGRAHEGGRQVVVRWRDGDTVDVSPAGSNARTRVHEYGGGSFQVRDGVVWSSRFEDQRLVRQDAPGSEPEPITPAPPVPGAWRYADVEVAPDGSWLVAVREVHGTDPDGSDPAGARDSDAVVNDLVALPAGGGADGGEPTVLASGPDFVSSPRLAPDGRRLAWLAWDHPDMPWDGTHLLVAEIEAPATDGPGGGVPVGLGEPVVVAGGTDEAIVGPTWLPDGSLVFATDRSGWWNLHRWDGEATVALTDVRADIGQPGWQFATASVAVVDERRLACVLTDQAVSRLAVLDLDDGRLTDVDQPLTSIRSVAAVPGGVVLLGGSETVEAAVVRVDLDGATAGGHPDGAGLAAPAGPPADGPATADPTTTAGPVTWLRRIATPGLDAAYAPRADALAVPTPDGATTHAFLYRPRHPEVVGPADERPPLVVFSHGGPTGHVAPVLSAAIAYFTSRGFAVADVNYRGSSGYGRAYRDALQGNWGIHDVTDVQAVARHLAERGEVDGDRLLIRGGSAGGFTTLAALVAEEPVFAAGANHFGVADLAALAEHTHKFESRYLDGLVGPYPQAAEVYRERSPLTHAHRLTTPVIVFQGDEDAVVPPAQSEAIVAAAAAAGVPHAYLLFEGEQHGFRRAENVERALEAELAFYGEVLGFTPADDIPPIDVRR